MIVGYINGQSLELHHSNVVEKSVDYLTADFQFMTNEWKGFRKWVHFSKGDIHYQIELKNDKVLKTDHLNLSSGEWDVYIHGSLEREVITTNKAKLVVEATGELEGEYPEETPIPPYDAILNLIGDLKKLDTETKKNLVSAINEVLKEAEENNGFQDIDLSDYALKTEIPTKISNLENDSGFITKKDLPEIDFGDIFEPFVGTMDSYVVDSDPIYWKDNTTIDRIDGTFKASVYPTCVTPEIYVVSDSYYKVEGSCYESDVYQYGFDGSFIGVSSLLNDGLFKVNENTATVRFIIPKFDDNSAELDLNKTIEYFGDRFKLYYCDKYKLKDNVLLPDNIVIPTKTSELENDSEFVTQSLETNEEGNNVLVFGGANK